MTSRRGEREKAKTDHIVRHSADALAVMVARGEDRTDWARGDATTSGEIEREASADGDDLPGGWQGEAIPGLPGRKEPVNLRQVRDDAERKAISKVLSRVDGNMVRAAELLGVSRPTLYDLINRHGLKQSVTIKPDEAC